ncbi:MAG: hypothetical protein V2J02_14055 [Pseudomonadales bacterium]|jgi:hypothetical protein|nr:hypothetical protein [Pseudomonadales bacterium]
MIRKITLAASVALLAGCGGGDINIQPTNVDNSVDNSTNTGGGGSTNPCANYTDPASNTVVQGTFDGSNCTYTSDFVGVNNPLTVDLVIPFISGVHIFEDGLFVGENVDSGPAPQEGEGPTLTIRAGNTLAFLDSQDYVLVNRGSQIIAQGSPSAPITFTAFSDAVTGTAGPEDVSLWGGIQINGNGITNNCTDAERANDQCHVLTEGQPSNYGGDNNTESSGVLSYVVTKHSGFEVVPGDELNGITLNAIGSGTQMDHIEVYSTFDDGLEWFGGAVEVEKVVMLYVRDDSLDYSDGFVGGITDALVIHPRTDGNRCIEADSIGQGRFDDGEALDLAPITNPTVTGLTCIPSGFDDGTHGDSEGPLLRLGARSQIRNMLVFGGYAVTANGDNNECFEIQDPEDEDTGLPVSDVTRLAAQNGAVTVTGSVIACLDPAEAAKGELPNGDALDLWVTDSGTADYGFNTVAFDDDDDPATPDVVVENVIELDPNNANTSILAANDYRTAGYDADADTTTITLSDGVTTVTIPGRLGAVSTSDDWTGGWTFGLKPANRAQPLYFE